MINKKFIFTLMFFFLISFSNSYWEKYTIDKYFILNNWHDLFKIVPKKWWWYIPRIQYTDPEAVKKSFESDWYQYMKSFYQKLWLKYKYINWKNNNSQFYIDFDTPLILKDYKLIKKELPDIYFSYRDPKTNKIRWIQWKKVNKYILWWYWTRENQLLILYPIIRKLNWRTEAFLQAPCGNMTCYDKKKCLKEINYKLSCEVVVKDKKWNNRTNFYDFENEIVWVNVYLDWKNITNYLKKFKIKYWWIFVNWKLINENDLRKIFNFSVWRYKIDSYIIDPFTNQRLNCNWKIIVVNKKNNSCSFYLNLDWKIVKYWTKINLLNWFEKKWDMKLVWFFYRSKKDTNNKWEIIPKNKIKNFILKTPFTTYQIWAIAKDINYNKLKVCWVINIKTTWNPWCKILNVKKCYNYWDKIYPIPIFNYDTYLKSIIFNLKQQNYNNSNVSRFYLIANKPWKNYLMFNVYNKYTNEEWSCSVEFVVNPKQYCWDWITNNNEECDYNDPKDWFYCTKECTIKPIKKCEILWLNYWYVWSNYSYYIKLPEFAKIKEVKVNWIKFSNSNNWKISILNNSGIIWKKIKIFVKIYNIYNPNDTNYCEKEIIIKKKPIDKYCEVSK